jgi:hypothetical protein
VLLVALILFDLLFVVSYLYSTLPEIRALTVNHTLRIINLSVEANIPTGYAVLKLLSGSLLAVAMIFSYERGRGVPVFWYLAAAVLFILAVDEMAQLHEVWAGGIAVKLLGDTLSGNQYTLFTHGPLLGSMYLSSLTLFPKKSKSAFTMLVLSGLTLILSQAPAEWQFEFGSILFDNTMGSVVARFGAQAGQVAWEEGLELLGYTLMVSALAFGIKDIQRNSVRYVYLGSD